jgi:hypothetical protein
VPPHHPELVYERSYETLLVSRDDLSGCGREFAARIAAGAPVAIQRTAGASWEPVDVGLGRRA